MITFDFEKKERLHIQILNLQKELNSRITNINKGGCIHFAYFLSKRLNELNISNKVYFLNVKQHHIVYPEQSADHVMVKVDKIGLIDGTSILKSFSNYKRRRQFKEDWRIVLKNPNWSKVYKKTQNQLLNNIIKKHLNGN